MKSNAHRNMKVFRENMKLQSFPRVSFTFLLYTWDKKDNKKTEVIYAYQF